MKGLISLVLRPPGHVSLSVLQLDTLEVQFPSTPTALRDISLTAVLISSAIHSSCPKETDHCLLPAVTVKGALFEGVIEFI